MDNAQFMSVEGFTKKEVEKRVGKVDPGRKVTDGGSSESESQHQKAP